MFASNVVQIGVSVLGILQLSRLCFCFNFDVKSAIGFSGPSPITGSYFGYSLDFYEYNNVKSILVGAPRTNGSVYEQGALYQCSKVSNEFSCRTIPTKGSGTASRAWLGATIVGRGGKTLSDHSGGCFHSNGSLDVLDFIGPQDSLTPLSAVGFSAALSQDTRNVYLGAPADSKNVGKLYFTSLASPIWSRTLSGDVGLYSYAIATGRVLANGGDGVVVSIGFHQNSQFAGKVVIAKQYNATLMIRESALAGYQSGEMFGASLAVIDLNGDNRDDIVIGAPHFTDFTQNNLRVEIGCVYVYYKTAGGVYDRGSPNERIIRGDIENGRFGLAVAAAGDTNADGYNDLAIGAPYENSGFGSVYLYHGSATGLRSRPGQVISGTHFTPALRSFGFSFSSSAHDFDGNYHSDLTVGAYQSDVVVHIPARPVVRLSAEIEFDPSYITMEKRDCTAVVPGEPPTSVPCVTMKYCLKYTGRNVPQVLRLNLSIALDVKQNRGQRLFFLSTNEYKMFAAVNSTLGVRNCWNEKVYVKPNIRDKLSPIEVTLMSKLLPTNLPGLVPILDALGENGTASRSLNIFRNCGDDQVCIPDLQMKITKNMDVYFQGSTERLVLDVDVFNAAEDSYGSEFFLQMPPTMTFVNVENEQTNRTVYCYPPKDEDRQEFLRCDIGNPLVAKQTARLRAIFKLQPYDSINSITFKAEVNSTPTEPPTTQLDNSQVVTIDVQAKASLQLSGYSRPEELLVNMSALYEKGQNALPNFTQFFEIQNTGPSDILSVQFKISLRSKTDRGDTIMRLTSLPIVSGANCLQSSNFSDSRYVVIDCTANRLSSHADSNKIFVRVSAELVADAIFKFGNKSNSYSLDSSITANITSMLYNQDVSSIPQQTWVVKIPIKKITVDETNLLQAMPFWIPLVSTIGAIIALCGILFLLRRFGFFKRKRPGQMAGQVLSSDEGKIEEDF